MLIVPAKNAPQTESGKRIYHSKITRLAHDARLLHATWQWHGNRSNFDLQLCVSSLFISSSFSFLVGMTVNGRDRQTPRRRYAAAQQVATERERERERERELLKAVNWAAAASLGEHSTDADGDECGGKGSLVELLAALSTNHTLNTGKHVLHTTP